VPEQELWTAIARIVKPQGRRGEVLAEILTDFPERYGPGAAAFLQCAGSPSPRPVTIESSWPHKDRIVLKLSGVDSISDAELLRGADLVIRPEDRMALEPGAAYIHDLQGCALVDLATEGAPVVGIVQDVIQQPETIDLLIVAAPDGSEHWIPFAAAYRPHIDLAARRVSLHLPAGILAINTMPAAEGEGDSADPGPEPH
jgi:16S rRNA processing protein RimM